LIDGLDRNFQICGAHHKFLRDEHGLRCVGGRIEDAAGFGTFVEYEEFRLVGFAEGIAAGFTVFK
jgi:hypothetical protein